MRSSTIWNLNFSVFRQFPVRKRMRFELRGEAFNLANTVIYGTPNASIADKLGFGTVSGTANDARTLQLAAKFLF